jgi:hypothetical protein
MLSAQTTTANVEQQDPATELGKFKKNCWLKHVMGCAEVLFTGQPLHIAVGSIAPQNGFGAGLAYVGHKDTDNWGTSWSADAIGSNNGSWRAGFFVKLVDTHLKPPTPVFGTASAGPTDFPVYSEQPVFNLYEQSISLNKLTFFGEGPATTVAGRSFYGMTEHIVGGSLVRPIYEPLNVGLYGEVNGRAISIRPRHGESSASIEQAYTPGTAPGLNHRPFFLQLGAGIRMRPSTSKGLLHLNYDLAYRPFIDVSGSGFSFQRLTADLYQEISFYHTNARVKRDTNDPNNCLVDPSVDRPRCPTVSRNLEGRLGLRAYTSLSMTPGSDRVPFYFQPTLGGADVNGNIALGSYQDYRFRAPNILLFQENLEHSIGKLPLGVTFRADQGRVGLTRGDLASSNWLHSYGVGLTLRAGGFPQVYFLYAFGGSEGSHTLVLVNTSLLGTAGRPSLF